MNWVQQTGLRFWTGVPCSFLARQWDCAFGLPDVVSCVAAQEGDAVAMACGAWLGGSTGAVLMQSSGLGNCVNPLTSLASPFGIPVLLVVSVRCDEPQHELMGALTPGLLASMGIGFSDFPGDLSGIQEALASRQSYALLVTDGKKGTSSLARETRPVRAGSWEPLPGVATRRSMLEAVRGSDLLIATTGYTGRELYALGDAANHLYMVGSMGCALSVGLGLALVQPSRRVIVLDGDGALLMRLGSLATCGHYRPENLVHVLLDNGVHDSTGGQPTASGTVDFCALAAACGYPVVERFNRPSDFATWLGSDAVGPAFVHLPIVSETGDLPRPEIHPREVAERFRGVATR